ncbi:MAG: F0F1 ATP synthase subunit A [Candidatus Latescibacteria bacterium]|nr:F0F1 ATP synthase subunit A [Candidatus Latescibacterota bacterium]NIM21209.1 F0F1 ATP synthase subunit A [Candidatus Latescibacterota bacterium]NIM65463.1 F0F1 ATP synthase subunit A [Candidatus Latescibacterota bacterium]NIO01841.1 F0F1 ATP synthase subunit A [Candidatus Latescibacterota bacterium]NIO28491.1 F0F1 ATP synthase subunit A [Candidatus Latescibacterota bacterium]
MGFTQGFFTAASAAENAFRWASEGAPELPNFITVLHHFFIGTSFGDFIHKWENVIFSLIIVVFLVLIAKLASRKPSLIPGKLQNLVEMIVEALHNFVVGILGPQGKHFVPFLGTLFIYILCMNLFGLFPLMKSPTSSINTTVALAICVFLYVQYTGIRRNGIIGYIDHMMGQPRNLIGIVLVPLMLPLHIVEELAKPMSLSLRLFGNITGEDVLIYIFVGLGVAVLSFTHLPVGIPLQIPFIFLAILTSFIQALVFMLLSTIYFSLMLPHHEEEEHH